MYYFNYKTHPICINLVEQYIICLTKEKEYQSNINKFKKWIHYGFTDYIPNYGPIDEYGQVIKCKNIRKMLLKCHKEIEQIEKNK